MFKKTQCIHQSGQETEHSKTSENLESPGVTRSPDLLFGF